MTVRDGVRLGKWLILRALRFFVLVFGWAIAVQLVVGDLHAPAWTAFPLMLPFGAIGSYFVWLDRKRGWPDTFR
jgi:hypothetical protein